MSRSTLEWYDMLARGLIWLAGVVFVLAIIGAVVIAGSSGSVPVPEDAEREGRGFFALISLGGGISAAGLLAGLGALLRLLLADRLAATEPERDERPRPRASRAKEATAETPKPKRRPAKKGSSGGRSRPSAEPELPPLDTPRSRGRRSDEK